MFTWCDIPSGNSISNLKAVKVTVHMTDMQLQYNTTMHNITLQHSSDGLWHYAPDFTRVTMSGSHTSKQNFITIHSGVFDPHVDEIVFTQFLFFICAFFRFATDKTVAPILMLNMSNGVIPRKDVPFWGHVHDAPYLRGKPQRTSQKGRE